MGIPEVLYYCTPAKNHPEISMEGIKPGEEPIYLAEREGAASGYAINQYIGAEDQEFFSIEVFSNKLDHSRLSPFNVPLFDRGKKSYAYDQKIPSDCLGKVESFVCPGRPAGWMNSILNGEKQEESK